MMTNHDIVVYYSALVSILCIISLFIKIERFNLLIYRITMSILFVIGFILVLYYY